MSNFVFSDNLELSIIEHRLTQIFQILEEINTSYFFPSIIFNESFWQSPYEKRKSIVLHNQFEWLGPTAMQKSLFHKDELYLDLVKSLRLTTFSYSKLDLVTLINLFKTKSKFSITEFGALGDPKVSPTKFLNDLFFQKQFDKDPRFKEFSNLNNLKTLAKISAVKFYTRFAHSKKENIKGLIHFIGKNSAYFETFFKSVEVVDSKQGTSLFNKINFFITDRSQSVIDEFINNIGQFPTLDKLYKNGQIFVEVLDVSDVNFKEAFDYIFVDYALGFEPGDVLIKDNNDVYELVARLTYTNRYDEEATIKKIDELQSPLKQYENITMVDLGNMDFEISFDLYKNDAVINILEENNELIEGKFVKFSQTVLAFLIKSVSALNKDGYLEIWDVCERGKTAGLGFFRVNGDGPNFSPVDYDFYLKVLNSLSDISIETNMRNLQNVISDEILDGRESFVPLFLLMQYLGANPKYLQRIFDIDNFKYKSELEKQANSLKFFQFFKRKGLMLFGLPSYLYNKGYKKFVAKINANSELAKYVNKEYLFSYNLKSYRDEYMAAVYSGILERFSAEELVVITKDLESPQNKAFYEQLENIGFEKEKVMRVVNEIWDDLVKYADENMNLYLVEIVKK